MDIRAIQKRGRRGVGRGLARHRVFSQSDRVRGGGGLLLPARGTVYSVPPSDDMVAKHRGQREHGLHFLCFDQAANPRGLDPYEYLSPLDWTFCRLVFGGMARLGHLDRRDHRGGGSGARPAAP